MNPAGEVATPSVERRVLVAPSAAAGLRLDTWLAAALQLEDPAGTSRSRVRALVDEGRVAVNGAPAKASLKLKGGERVVVDPRPPQPTSLVAEDLPLSVVYEDEDVVVLDKAAGVVVHPGAGNLTGTLANALAFHRPGIAVGGELRPGIVHRLDKDTSGLIVVAKNERAHRRLSDAFKARDVVKRYVAFCLGRPKKDVFELSTGHARHATDRRRFTTKLKVDAPGTRAARSKFVVTASAGGVSEVEVDLLTGRTHQIRAHLADIGHPLVHDGLYGGAKPATRLTTGPVRDAVLALHRHGLHARDLAFPHPATGARLAFSAPLPADLARLDVAVRAVQGGAA